MKQALQDAETGQNESQQQAQETQKANARLEEQQQQLQQQNEEFQQLTVRLKEQQQQQLREDDEREQLEQHLEQERRLLRKLVDNLPDYIYVKDLQNRFILANLPLARSAGVSHPEELLGKSETFYRAEQALMQSRQELRNQGENVENNGTGKAYGC